VFSLRLVQTPVSIAAYEVVVHLSRAPSSFNADHQGRAKESTLSVVDLAGSERASRTNNTGLRLTEASNINKSLSSLKRCMETLNWNCSRLPQTDPRV